MQDIVAATGLSGPAVYRHVGSKEELAVSAAVESAQQVTAAFAALPEAEPLPGPTAALNVMMRQRHMR